VIVKHLLAHRTHRRHGGYTLIELLIAMVVALFLLGGLLTLVQTTRSASVTQNQLVQLQDGERLAMTLMADVIEATGYFPDPTTQTLANFPVVAGVFAAGQVLTGASAGGPPGDTISVRFITNLNDTIINCSGGTNNLANGTIYSNAFSVDAQGNLNCTLSINGVAQAPIPLITGVQNLQVWYGVKRVFAVSDYNVDTYVATANMLPADWNNVTAVKVRLTFTNPLAKQAGQAKQANYIERVIGVMSRTGVKT
jgi:type IV pilus assembly protein PilW